MVGCTGASGEEAPSWKAIVVNGGAEPASNWSSHRTHLERMVDALERRGLRSADIQVLASDGRDPTPDLTVVAARPDPGELPAWLVAPGPVFDPGGPLARLLPQAEVVDTAWTRTAVAPATRAELRKAISAAQLEAGEVLLLTTTDHGAEDGSLELWHEQLPADSGALATVFASLPDGVRVLVVMSQCHSGAFARPLLELRQQHGIDICGIFSVPEDRQATGCFPERDGEEVGHAFDIAAALRRADTLDAAHRDVVMSDRGPDVPIRTSDVWLWDRIVEEVGPDATPEELAAWVDEVPPPQSVEARALRAALGVAAGGLQQQHADTDRALGQIDVLTLRADAHGWAMLDLSARIQKAAMPRSEPWPGRLSHAARQLGVELSSDLGRRARDADAELWTAMVHEAGLARLGWLSARESGLARFGGEAPLKSLLACESSRLPGTAEAAPRVDWSAPLPSAEAPRWLGVQLEETAQGSRVVAVHPEGPAAGVVEVGDRIVAAAGQVAPVPAVLATVVLAAEGALPLTLSSGRSVAVEPVPLSPRILPVLAPQAGDPMTGVLGWLEPAPDEGAQLVVFTGPACPACRAAVARSEQWAAAAGMGVTVVADPTTPPSPGVHPDPGGFVADAFGIAVYPSVVAVDAEAQVVWRVDGWEPGAGVDLPLAP